MMAERSTALSTEFLTIIHRGGHKNIAFFSYSRQMKALFPLLLSSLLLFLAAPTNLSVPKMLCMPPPMPIRSSQKRAKAM